MPVSVKTRIGYRKNDIKEWIPALLEEKPAVLTVHFRTREELYMPPAHWEVAEEIIKMRNEISPETLIFGNGDITSLKQAKELAEKYGLDGVMVGRGLLGNPWFFSGKKATMKEMLQAAVEHAETFEKIRGETNKKFGWQMNFHDLRKHFHAYTKGFKRCKTIREDLMKVNNLEETKKAVEAFLAGKQ